MKVYLTGCLLLVAFCETHNAFSTPLVSPCLASSLFSCSSPRRTNLHVGGPAGAFELDERTPDADSHSDTQRTPLACYPWRHRSPGTGKAPLTHTSFGVIIFHTSACTNPGLGCCTEAHRIDCNTDGHANFDGGLGRAGGKGPCAYIIHRR